MTNKITESKGRSAYLRELLSTQKIAPEDYPYRKIAGDVLGGFLKDEFFTG